MPDKQNLRKNFAHAAASNTGAWLLLAAIVGVVAVSGGSPTIRIAAACVLLAVAAYRLRSGKGKLSSLAPAPEPAIDERAALLSKAAVEDGQIAAIRFNEYRALACVDHDQAEAAMTTLQKRLAHGIRGGEASVARVEADILATRLNGREGAIETLNYMLGQPLTVGKSTVRPTVAIGVASTGQSAATGLARAIAACGPPPAIEFQENSVDFAIEQELAAAIAEGALSLHYQPIFDVAAGRVSGAEALLRWQSPKHGQVSPALFVPILERSRLIHDAGLWAFSTACRDAAGWAARGLDLTVAVNVSARQIQDGRLSDAVRRSLARNGLAANKLELELTETAAMADMASTQLLFSDLREQGVRLSIDDFGAGYSNLNYLRSLPFDKLKIDRQFVVDVDSRADSQAICRAIVALADGLGLDLLAEGVEREAEADTLRNLGCRLFQGYYFGRPMAPEDFIAFAEDGERQKQLASPVHRQLAALNERLAS